MKHLFILITVSLSLFSAGLPAAEPVRPGEAEVPAPPPMPEGPEPPHVYDDEEGFDGRKQVQADVTIIREKDRTLEEYRVNGELYMVKVNPSRGKPYYLLYKSGAGNHPVRRELDDLQTPYWKLFEW